MSHTKPAFWIHVVVPAGIFPKIQPEDFSSVRPPPTTPTVMTSGMSTCIVVTPALPSPAFKPSARPCFFLG